MSDVSCAAAYCILQLPSYHLQGLLQRLSDNAVNKGQCMLVLNPPVYDGIMDINISIALFKANSDDSG
jgi:hypothetical protein